MTRRKTDEELAEDFFEEMEKAKAHTEMVIVLALLRSMIEDGRINVVVGPDDGQGRLDCRDALEAFDNGLTIDIWLFEPRSKKALPTPTAIGSGSTH